MNRQKTYYFFIGTEAELIKMMPVIKNFVDSKRNFKIISSGQNNIGQSQMLTYLGRKIDILLFDGLVVPTPIGLISWMIRTFVVGFYVFYKEFGFAGVKSNNWLVVHGDTVSTLLGSLLGRIYGLKVAHVEAGYKSPNLFSPFPEEIDRRLASFLSSKLFCPFDSIGNKRIPENKKSINIGLNTSVDTLFLALNTKTDSKVIRRINSKKFFIFALHRQETLINKAKFKMLLETMLDLASTMTCVFTMHSPTKRVLYDLNMFHLLDKNENIIITERLPYFEYAKLLSCSEFIMTDGVGNQQETYYLGKPCLLLRNVTEGAEGVDSGNAMLYGDDVEKINYFMNNYKKFKRDIIQYEVSPSRVISEYLMNN